MIDFSRFGKGFNKFVNEWVRNFIDSQRNCKGFGNDFYRLLQKLKKDLKRNLFDALKM